MENLNCQNQNRINENMELLNKNSNNSIFISGLCDPSTIDLSQNKMWKQETLDSYISILNTQSEIKQVDSINAKIDVLNTKVIETPTYNNMTTDNHEGKNTTGRKLVIQGLLCLTVNYVENTPEQPVNSFIGNVPFSSYIILPKMIEAKDTLTLNFAVSSCIEAIQVNSIKSNNIYISAIFTLLANKLDAMCDDDINCFSDNGNCDTSSCMLSQSPRILGVCPVEKIRNLFTSVPNPEMSKKYWNEISVPEVLTISESKPDIEELLSLSVDVEILSKKIIKTPKPTQTTNYENKKLFGKKLIIEAILYQRLTYISKDSSNSIYSCNFSVPVSTYIVLPEPEDLSTKFEVACCIEDIYTCALNNRQIFKGINIFFKATPVKCVVNNVI